MNVDAEEFVFPPATGESVPVGPVGLIEFYSGEKSSEDTSRR